MKRLRAAWRRVRTQGFTPTEFQSICVGALVLLSAIVVSGAVVRLTGSGLGCDDWPNCNDSKLIDVSSTHSLIEQVNRFFTFAVCIGVALAAIAAWIRRPRRRDLLALSLVMLIGVPAQGIVGAIVVWTDLHPVAVQFHLLLSMVLVAAAVFMIARSRQADAGERVLAVSVAVRRRVMALAIATSAAVVAGSVVTGTGPHAGDEEARRFFGTSNDIDGNALLWATRVHSAVVWVAVAIAASLLVTLRRQRDDRRILDAAITAWFVIALVQGTLGYVQYAAGLPAVLVGVHVALATALFACTMWLVALTTRVEPT